MCKVLVMAGIDDAHRDNAIQFIQVMAGIISNGNSDGLGYAAVDKDGNLFAERWLSNDEAFRHQGLMKEDKLVMGNFKQFAKYKNIERIYSSHGTPDLNKITAITLHARAASGKVCIENVHPFIDEDTSVIHNGYILNYADFKIKLSSCDSEAILISYLKNKIGSAMTGVKELAKELAGYYAVGSFARDATGARVLDVYKSNNDNLNVAYVEELGTWVMSSAGANIVSACFKLGFTVGAFLELKDEVLMRFDPNTGALLGSEEFTNSPKFMPVSTVKNTGSDTTDRKVIPFNKKSNLTPEEIKFLSLVPAIEKMNVHDKWDFLAASGYWN